ncbi:MAG TPA: hypothetical protein VF794_12735 [Archangium sp.]|jgi:hypothetical protein|uniref:hypothetical protein n=1 Tax=Archangium sp. TaxID=1872627 RepID=UPI002ED9D7DE
MSQETAEKKRALKKPIEEIRAELMKDPDTARIAKAVSMELADYVEKVLTYLQYPDRRPEFEVAEDEELRAAGYNPMTEQDVHDVFAAAVRGDLDPGAQFQKSGFDSADGRKGPATGGASNGAIPAGPQDDAQRQELMEQIKKGSVPRG